MWTETTQPQYERKGLRYSSDVTDAEWLVISPHLPQRKRFGRPPKTALTSIVDAVLYIATTRCQWRVVPRQVPPFTTVQNYFLCLARQRRSGADQLRVVGGNARSCRARSQPPRPGSSTANPSRPPRAAAPAGM